jgi:ribosomal protein S27E
MKKYNNSITKITIQGRKDGLIMKENGKVVKCPKCDSDDVAPAHPFDYVKQCNACGEQFSTGVHN